MIRNRGAVGYTPILFGINLNGFRINGEENVPIYEYVGYFRWKAIYRRPCHPTWRSFGHRVYDFRNNYNKTSRSSRVWQSTPKEQNNLWLVMKQNIRILMEKMFEIWHNIQFGIKIGIDMNKFLEDLDSLRLHSDNWMCRKKCSKSIVK